ncbi:hypothetical protein IJG78_03305 [Candidatus Saccharibacteria bacterium]|nr:hypothetical protein [Candidatus Saccharibacteria bacterium]
MRLDYFFSTGSTKVRRYPLSYIYSGYYHWGNGNLDGQGTDGYWWSTSAYSSTNAYDLIMASSVLKPQNNNNKAVGFPLRFLSTPPAPPKPADIRFRIYILVPIYGVMAP